mmetsp:Transcript_103506/g.267870  ORF Transcript_103506/g.267870 Transcript_103506/m.267870 type:complete len:200 (-) Transcript_103506:167-766(-)
MGHQQAGDVLGVDTQQLGHHDWGCGLGRLQRLSGPKGGLPLQCCPDLPLRLGLCSLPILLGLRRMSLRRRLRDRRQLGCRFRPLHGICSSPIAATRNDVADNVGRAWRWHDSVGSVAFDPVVWLESLRRRALAAILVVARLAHGRAGIPRALTCQRSHGGGVAGLTSHRVEERITLALWDSASTCCKAGRRRGEREHGR